MKGEPGTGKTMLAFELLRMYGKGVYVSTRVAEEKTLEQYPGVQALFRQGKFLVTSPEIKGASYKDVRLGTAPIVIESVLESISKLKEPLVILDSWDAVAKELDPVERLKAEKTLLALADAKKARLVFISEEPALTSTDYLVDAIVVLRDELFDGRRARRIEWKKLRGSDISQPSHLFSLHEARFNVFQRVDAKPPDGYEAKAFRPIKNTGEYYSTGSKDLDALLGGGMKKGLRVLLELGKHVGSDWHVPLMASMTCNFILNGGCCTSIPTLGQTTETIKEFLSNHLPAEAVGSSLRIGHFGETQSDDRCFFQMDPNSSSKSFETFWKATEEVRVGEGGGRRACLLSIGMDKAEATFGSEDLGPLFARGAAMIERYGDAAVFLVKQSTRSKDMLADIADAFLKLDQIDGSPVIYSVKPPSRIYHVQYDYNQGYPSVGLTPES